MRYLVIGYGNTLRSDDGAGQYVADAVTSWNLPQVRSLACHQLTPELAAEIATVDTVVFVDAIAPSQQISEVTVERLENANPNGGRSTLTDRLPHPTASTEYGAVMGHSETARSLLSLTQRLYGSLPEAYCILLPAVNFDFGETLSPITQQAVITALEIIKTLWVNGDPGHCDD